MRAVWRILMVLGALAMAGPAWPAERAAAPKTVAQRLDLARQGVDRAEKRAEGIALCEEIIASPSTESKDLAAAFDILISILRRQDKFDDAVRAADRMRVAFQQDKEMEQKAVFAAVDLLRLAKKDADALAKLKEYIGRQAGNKKGAAEAQLQAARILLETGKFADSRDAAAKALELDSESEKGESDALVSMIDASWRLEDLEKCRELFPRLFAAKGFPKRDIWQRRELQRRYGECLRRLKRFDEALAHYAALETAEADPKEAAYTCILIGDLLTELNRPDEALKTYERVFTAHAQNTENWWSTQQRIVTILTKKGNFEDAIRTARVLMDASTEDRVLADTVRMMAEIFKGLDKNLARANALINYQRYGPAGPDGQTGTADDLKDPLEGIGYPSYPDRDKALAEARKAAGDDSKAMRYRAMTYLYSGHPKDALRCFMDAFARCTGDEFQQTGQDMVLIGARAARGHAVGLDLFFHFVNYGPAGPDGKPGTADDLADPFAPLLK